MQEAKEARPTTDSSQRFSEELGTISRKNDGKTTEGNAKLSIYPERGAWQGRLETAHGTLERWGASPRLFFHDGFKSVMKKEIGGTRELELMDAQAEGRQA